MRHEWVMSKLWVSYEWVTSGFQVGNEEVMSGLGLFYDWVTSWLQVGFKWVGKTLIHQKWKICRFFWGPFPKLVANFLLFYDAIV